MTGVQTCALPILAYQYQREKEYKVDLLDIQLQDYNERLHQELARIPDSLWNTTLERYLQKYIKQDLRITVVNVQGDVLYDSYENQKLGNHINRPVVQKALAEGKGYDVRRTSETTGVPYFYSATLYEGYIIRSALPDRKSTRLNSSHPSSSRMPSSA